MPTNEQVSDAHDKLRDFFNFVYHLLRELATNQRDPRDQRLFREEFEALIKDAWSEFESDFNLEKSLERIRYLESSQLRSHGLYGNQLNLKLRVVGFWNEVFQKIGGVRIFKKLIGVIDTLLESILGATGIDGAIKELKDTLVDSTDD